jgi:Leucine-rich repeat (LRR) protein
LGELSKLESLGLFENKLYGSIPGELGKLGQLKELVLANNELGGEIPKEFGQLGSLKVLQIQNNNIFSFDNMEGMNSGQFLVFDYDKVEVEKENKYKDFDVIKTRMADTKFEDEMEE